MNVPKQSRPVIRDVSRDPIRARVEGAQTPCQIWCAGLEAPGSNAFNRCVNFCEREGWTR
jgi:hypothetical protein